MPTDPTTCRSGADGDTRPRRSAPLDQQFPASLWQHSQGCWALGVHGLPSASMTLVCDEHQAKQLAAAMLCVHLHHNVRPEQISLVWREDPATTLARMDADPALTVAQLLDASRLPAPTP